MIQIVLRRMEKCIKGELAIDGYSEKKHEWPLFEKLMLSAWLRIFEPQNEIALEIAYEWAQVAEGAFSSGSYSREDDIAAFTKWQGRKPKSGFETGFGMFYHAVLLPGVMAPVTESLFLDYYLPTKTRMGSGILGKRQRMAYIFQCLTGGVGRLELRMQPIESTKCFCLFVNQIGSFLYTLNRSKD